MSEVKHRVDTGGDRDRPNGKSPSRVKTTKPCAQVRYMRAQLELRRHKSWSYNKAYAAPLRTPSTAYSACSSRPRLNPACRHSQRLNPTLTLNPKPLWT